MINFATPAEEKKNDMLNTIQRKMLKAYGRSDMMKCIPIIWHEISRVKGRVDEVLCTLSNKRVKEEKLLEFKK